MARISGVNLPTNKRVKVALTYIYGIGNKIADDLLRKSKIDPRIKVKDMTESEILNLRELIKDIIIEGDLKRNIQQDIRRLTSIACYRGIRHKKKLPVHGQRTHTNARTRRGRRIAVAGKKKVTK